jgi:adenylate cyclase
MSHVFSNRHVLVGARPHLGFTGAGKDTFFHPYHRTNMMAGLEVHATMLANLLREDWLTRLPTVVELFLLGLAGAGFGWGLPRLRPGAAWGAAVLGGAVVTWLAVSAMWWGRVWFPWLIVVLAQIPAALLLAFALRYLRTRLAAERLRHSFGVYASERLATEIARNPDLLRLGSKPCELSVLFCDLVGSCRIGERLDSADYRALLQGYYDMALECFFQRHGMVMNIVGDCIFAVWNTPLSPQADHARLACEAAVLLQERLAAFNRQQTGPELAVRIGLHCGAVSVGNFGSPARMVYTAIGDEVNLASRLEGLNKYLGTHTLASRTVQRSVERDLPARRLGFFRFQGFDRSVEVVELLCPGADEPPTDECLTAFAEGLRQFRRYAFAEAEAAFREARRLRPQDGVAGFYLDEAIPQARLGKRSDKDEFCVVILPGK